MRSWARRQRRDSAAGRLLGARGGRGGAREPGAEQPLSIHLTAPGGGARRLPAASDAHAARALIPEEELRAEVLQLREPVEPLKETLGSQREAIHELTGELLRCQGLASGKARGAEGHGQGHYGWLWRGTPDAS